MRRIMRYTVIAIIVAVISIILIFIVVKLHLMAAA
jgi:hypothetical protein